MAAPLLCLDVGGTELKGAPVDRGTLLAPLRHFPARSGEDRETLLDHFAAVFRELDAAGYARQAGLSDPNLLDFGTYSRDYFRENSMRTMGEKLDAMGVSEADRELMLEAAGEFNLRYFTGRTVDYREELAALPGYALWNELPDGMGDYFAFILDSEKKDETQGDFGSLWLKGENT